VTLNEKNGFGAVTSSDEGAKSRGLIWLGRLLPDRVHRCIALNRKQMQHLPINVEHTRYGSQKEKVAWNRIQLQLLCD
jgi:hypothetical protein